MLPRDVGVGDVDLLADNLERNSSRDGSLGKRVVQGLDLGVLGRFRYVKEEVVATREGIKTQNKLEVVENA